MRDGRSSAILDGCGTMTLLDVCIECEFSLNDMKSDKKHVIAVGIFVMERFFFVC